MTGVLVVDKPAGPTSHDVVARVRRVLRERRIGHTGTLDPLATGVLPLVVGSATRLASLLTGEEKEYVAEVRLGVSTDTYDATGTLSSAPPERDAGSVTREDLERTLATFGGTYEQTPPAFSAKKVGGVRSYKLARRSQAVALAPAPVTVSTLTLEDFAGGLARIRIVCSAGFYVRSLAHDLGRRLRCGALLEGLRRTRSGSFTEADAVPLEAIEAAGIQSAARLISGSRLLPELPFVVLTARGLQRASHGNWLAASDLEGGQSPFLDPEKGDCPPYFGRKGDSPPFRLLDGDGRLVGIAEWRADGLLHPVVVLV